eukprot:gene19717-23612_t
MTIVGCLPLGTGLDVEYQPTQLNTVFIGLFVFKSPNKAYMGQKLLITRGLLASDTTKIPRLLSESLTYDLRQHSLASRSKLFYFGKLVYNTVISHEIDMDGEIFKEFMATVRAPTFLRKQCERLGLAEFVIANVSERPADFQQYYTRHYVYRCFMQFLGALYLERGFQVTRSFILTHVLEQPAKLPETFILEEPESQLFQKFVQYKIEPPRYVTRPSSHSNPLYKSMIYSGSKNLVYSYGLSESESMHSAIEHLNTKCGSITSVLSLLVQDNPITDQVKQQ